MFEEKVKKFTEKLAQISRAASFLTMIILTFDIITTKLFNVPIRGAKSYTEMLMVLLIFTSIPYVTAYNTHITVDLIKFGEKTLKVLEVCVRILGIGLSGLLTWRSFVFIQQVVAKKTVMTGTEGWLDMPIWILALFLVFGYGLTTLIYIMQLVLCFTKKKEEKPE